MSSTGSTAASNWCSEPHLSPYDSHCASSSYEPSARCPHLAVEPGLLFRTRQEKAEGVFWSFLSRSDLLFLLPLRRLLLCQLKPRLIALTAPRVALLWTFDLPDWGAPRAQSDEGISKRLWFRRA